MTVSARPGEGGFIQVSVHDDGPGMTDELRAHAFDRFVKEPGSAGSGLGLAICRDLVEAHGGRIWIDCAVGRGTTVSFTLPRPRVRLTRPRRDGVR